MQKVDVNMIENIKKKDFSDIIYANNILAGQMYVKKTGDRRFSVAVPLGGKKYAIYAMLKDGDDDYIKFSNVDIAELATQDLPYMKKNADQITGTWNTASIPNYYATAIGSKATFSFEGSGFTLMHYADTRGGMFKLTVDGQFVQNISTHVDAIPVVPNTTYRWQTIKGFANGQHNAELEFIGADPTYPPLQNGSPVAPRGWMVFEPRLENTYRTIEVLRPCLEEVTEGRFRTIEISSNKEYAIIIKKNGSPNPGYFMPDHGTGIVFAADQRVLFDGVAVTDWTKGYYEPVNDVVLVQKMDVIHPSDGKLVDLTETKTINHRGVSYVTRFDFLEDTFSSSGYVNMFPINREFGDELLTNFGSVYPSVKSDGSRTNLLVEKDQANEYVYCHDSTQTEKRDYVALMRVHNIADSFRHDQPNRYQGDQIVWLEHRNTVMQKLYPQVTDGYVFKKGEVYIVSATYYVGRLLEASKLLR